MIGFSSESGPKTKIPNWLSSSSQLVKMVHFVVSFIISIRCSFLLYNSNTVVAAVAILQWKRRRNLYCKTDKILKFDWMIWRENIVFCAKSLIKAQN